MSWAVPGERDAYRDVGQATRSAIARALQASNLSKPALKVLLGVIAHTTTWSRLEDSIASAQLQAATGLDSKGVRRGLHELAAAGVIDHTPGGSEPGRGRFAARVRIPTPPTGDPRSEQPPVQTDPGTPRPHDRGSNQPATGGHHDPHPRSTEKPEQHAAQLEALAQERLDQRIAAGERIHHPDAIRQLITADLQAEASAKADARDRAQQDLAATAALLDERPPVDRDINRNGAAKARAALRGGGGGAT